MKEFIDQHRDVYGVEPICKVLPIAPSTYYLQVARESDPAQRSARAQRDERLCGQIQQVWDENLRAYGADKVWRQLRREGVEVARCTVERLMRRLGLKTERLAEAGIEPSMGSVGDSYDNALAETIHGLYKAEVIHRKSWQSLEKVEWATLTWVDGFNHRRLL